MLTNNYLLNLISICFTSTRLRVEFFKKIIVHRFYLIYVVKIKPILQLTLYGYIGISWLGVFLMFEKRLRKKEKMSRYSWEKFKYNL